MGRITDVCLVPSQYATVQTTALSPLPKKRRAGRLDHSFRFVYRAHKQLKVAANHCQVALEKQISQGKIVALEPPLVPIYIRSVNVLTFHRNLLFSSMRKNIQILEAGKLLISLEQAKPRFKLFYETKNQSWHCTKVTSVETKWREVARLNILTWMKQSGTGIPCVENPTYQFPEQCCRRKPWLLEKS